MLRGLGADHQHTTDAAGIVTYFNEAAVELAGRRPVIGRDQWSVSWKLYWPDGRPLPHEECPMALAVRVAFAGCSPKDANLAATGVPVPGTSFCRRDHGGQGAYSRT